jgi:hypothetical protein
MAAVQPAVAVGVQGSSARTIVGLMGRLELFPVGS